MSRTWRKLTLAAAGALALPAALAVASSGSCSLVQLYDGADGGGGGGAPTGTGGSDAGADVASPCPPEMYNITLTASAGYCIDRLEVTNLQYAKFLAQADASAPQAPPGVCDWNNSYAPAVPVSSGDTLPVLGVDWCDAYAYCRWANKRLCGSTTPGASVPANAGERDVITSQWYRACSQRGARVYPYTGGFIPTACADCIPPMCSPDASPPNDGPIPVGSRKSCVGGYPGIYDMSGNAAEWEDGCDDGGTRPDATDDGGKPILDPRFDTCFHRGGSFWEHNTPLGQTCLGCSAEACPIAGELRSHRPHNVGLRCCLDY